MVLDKAVRALAFGQCGSQPFPFSFFFVFGFVSVSFLVPLQSSSCRLQYSISFCFSFCALALPPPLAYHHNVWSAWLWVSSRFAECVERTKRQDQQPYTRHPYKKTTTWTTGWTGVDRTDRILPFKECFRPRSNGANAGRVGCRCCTGPRSNVDCMST